MSKRLNNLKFLFAISTMLFIIGLIFGIILILKIPLNGEIIKNQPEPGWTTSLSIFKNNLLVCLILLSGIITFGIPTILFLLYNGFSIGAGLMSIILLDSPISTILIKLIPHGLFEIPTFLFSGAIGLLGFTFYFNKNKPYKLILKYIIIIVIAIFIAALIEGLISIKL